jgi:pimeloyl-ACP methyl ester carboxylesterase
MIWLVVHGAWSAGWAWKKMRARLHAGGSQLWTPTMTGVGERVHLAGPEVTLDTHIQDIIGVIETEDLADITLVAHSYGGMVGTAVADRVGGRVKRLIYLDAFVPDDGQSQADILGPAFRAPPDGRVPPRANPEDTSAEDAAWINPRRVPQPVGAFTTKVRLSGRPLPPRAYIRCLRLMEGDPVKSSAEKAKAAGWPYREIDASHSPHITAPDLLASTLKELAAQL